MVPSINNCRSTKIELELFMRMNESYWRSLECLLPLSFSSLSLEWANEKDNDKSSPLFQEITPYIGWKRGRKPNKNTTRPFP